MAQLVEQLIRNQQVASSSLAISSKTKPLTIVRGFVLRLTSFFKPRLAVPHHVILACGSWRSRTSFARLSSRSRKVSFRRYSSLFKPRLVVPHHVILACGSWRSARSPRRRVFDYSCSLGFLPTAGDFSTNARNDVVFERLAGERGCPPLPIRLYSLIRLAYTIDLTIHLPPRGRLEFIWVLLSFRPKRGRSPREAEKSPAEVSR